MVLGIGLGCQTTSSAYTTAPSITAETLRSEPPASNPIRQPFRWPPSFRDWLLAAGKSRSDTASSTKGRSNTVSMKSASNARLPPQR